MHAPRTSRQKVENQIEYFAVKLPECTWACPVEFNRGTNKQESMIISSAQTLSTWAGRGAPKQGFLFSTGRGMHDDKSLTTWVQQLARLDYTDGDVTAPLELVPTMH